MAFEKHYLASLFQETGEDISASEKSSAIRNSLVRLHNEGINSLSNAATCTILDQRLRDYSQVSNDDSKEGSMCDMLLLVNNLLKGKVQTRHCVNWQSKLRSSKINPKDVLIESLKATGHCNASRGRPCNTDKLNKEGLNILFKKIPQSNIQPSNLLMKEQGPTDLPTNNQMQSSTNVFGNNSLLEPKLSWTTYKPHQILDDIENSLNTFEQNVNHINNQPHVSSNSKCVGNISNKSDYINSNKSFNFKHNLRNTNSNNIYETNPQKPVHNNVKYENTIWKRMEPNNTNLQKDNDNNLVNNVNAFRTARAEMQIQNKQKYGNSKQNHGVPELNTVVKRSLGTTRSNVQSKFIPPFSTSSESQPSSPPGDETIEDERLKHIDPKMIEFIRSEIIDCSAPISWDDIAGLEFAKSAIQEAVIWPLLRPDIFTGLRRPPKGILLFGPPGTGKTLIGKCIASQCYATFFSISASSLTSKWIGDGEKMVRALFAVARCHQPAVVFIDEIDSLLTQRSDTEHEATRRIKTEFLVQLDGAATGDEDRFLVIGATNRPQELDEAARRRFVKRLYIPLPETKARQQIIRRLMSTERNSLTEYDIERLSQMTNGYSGADMRSLCSEAALGPIRAVPFSQIANIQCDQVRPVNAEDFERGLTRVRPSVSSNDLEHYTVWDKTYGSGSGLY